MVAIDGKRLRGSYDRSSDKAAIHRVSAWACANRVVLGQVKTEEKSNEISAIPELLRSGRREFRCPPTYGLKFASTRENYKSWP